tara:strand:- start:2083 stop:3699 length:1617 start_codon:yes stop_codon:yes gene_type:complete
MKHSKLEVGIYAVLISMFFYYLFVASNLFLMSHDAFLYLNNAKLLLGDASVGFAATSQPLLSVIAAPFILIFDSVNAFTAIKFVMVILSFLFLYVSWLFFRKQFDKEMATLGVFLVSLNIVFIHFVPAILPDILSGLVITVTLLAYLHARKSSHFLWYGITSFFILLSFMAKLPNGAIVLIIILFEVFEKNWKMLTSKRFWIMLLLPFVVYYVIFSAAYTLFYGVDQNSIVGVFKSVFGLIMLNRGTELTQTLYNVEYQDPAFEYLFELYLGTSFLIMILAFMGLILLCKNWNKHDKLTLAWILGFVIPYLFVHRESRYMFVFFPAFYYLVIKGLTFIKAYLNKFDSRKAKSFWYIFLIVLFAIPAYNAFAQITTYANDPVYFDDFPVRVSDYAYSEAKGKSVYFVGNGYNIQPERFTFTDYDETMFLYLIGETQLIYFSGKELPTYEPSNKVVYTNKGVQLENPLQGVAKSMAVLTKKEVVNPLQDGDILILAESDGNFYTHNIPDNFEQDLFVYKVHIDDNQEASLELLRIFSVYT